MSSTTLAAAALLASLLTLPVPARAGRLGAAAGDAGEYVDGEVLVKFRSPSAAASSAALAARGHQLLRQLDRPGLARVRLRAGETVEEALAAYAADPEIEHAQPNYVYRATETVPNDALFASQWGLRNTGQYVSGNLQPGGALYTMNNPGTSGSDLNLTAAWDYVQDCSSVVVAVVDSGVNYLHQDLAPSMWDGGVSYPHHGWDFVGAGDDDPTDAAGHGTHVAGIIGARGNDSARSTGVCWRASIMAVRVLDAGGMGTTASILDGIDFAVANGAHVINMSLGGQGPFDPLFSDALTSAQNADVVVVVAAGNDAVNVDATAVWPCRFTHPNLLCVAALDQSFWLATFSNWGPISVDVGAPGTNILAPWAETTARVSDDMFGWTRTTTTASGWSNKYLTLGGVTTPFVVNPSTFPGAGGYDANTDARIWRTFATSAADVSVDFLVGGQVVSGDWIAFALRPTTGDPFVAPALIDGGSIDTKGYAWPLSYDISAWAGATCSIGFQLASNASVSGVGVGITGFQIRATTGSTTALNTIHGTSMASPMVAGIAAMVRQRNPAYDAIDVVEAIKASGRSAPSLAGKSTTARVPDAMAAIAHLRPPRNLQAAIY